MSKPHFIGIDITDTERFGVLLRDSDNKVFNKIFTAGELDYCLSSGDPASHLAARFAAKEAVIKAISAAGLAPISVRQIEVVSGGNKVPRVVLRTPGFESLTIQISLSHSEKSAIAVALIVQ